MKKALLFYLVYYRMSNARDSFRIITMKIFIEKRLYGRYRFRLGEYKYFDYPLPLYGSAC